MRRATTIAWSTCLLLVLLRLAIGWHFFVEGVEKVHSVAMGKTETNRPFSSVPLLRESSGPFSGFFHWQAGGDPDEAALARLAVKPLPEGQDSARTPYHERLPPALEKDWNDYLERFAAHYQLDEKQRQEATAKLDQRKENAVRWLLGLEGEREAEKADFPTAPFKVKETPRQRIDEYRATLAEVRRVQDQELPAFGRDTYRQKLRTLKAGAARMRTELLAELDRPMQEDLQGVLTADQKKYGVVPPPPLPAIVEWTDWGVSWGLVAVGVCLLLGFLTRTSCVVGAGFLLMLFLAMLPLPWLPENIRAEGHYLFVNKNLIEALALLALATTRSGRWVGLDGLLQFLNPWRWRAAEPAPAARKREPARVHA